MNKDNNNNNKRNNDKTLLSPVGAPWFAFRVSPGISSVPRLQATLQKSKLPSSGIRSKNRPHSTCLNLQCISAKKYIKICALITSTLGANSQANSYLRSPALWWFWPTPLPQATTLRGGFLTGFRRKIDGNDDLPDKVLRSEAIGRQVSTSDKLTCLDLRICGYGVRATWRGFRD